MMKMILPICRRQSTRPKRTCKCGAGQEATLGKCDTPGFELSLVPCIKRDHRRANKLHMPRNHSRVNQCSLNMLQSWRGNCDIQILMCDCNPKCPSISELAVVTDYIVSHACKGNSTLKEERDQCRAITLGWVRNIKAGIQASSLPNPHKDAMN